MSTEQIAEPTADGKFKVNAKGVEELVTDKGYHSGDVLVSEQLAPLHPWPPARRLPLSALGTRYSSPRCRAAQSTSSRRWLPTWWRRCRSFCPSAAPLALLAAAPSKHFPMRALVYQPASARDGHMIRRPLIQPNLQKLPQNTTTPPRATRCLVRSRSLQRNQSASPGNTSQAPETGGPASRDRTSDSGLRKTRRTLHAPTSRSAADRKDGLELLPDPDGTRVPLAADAVSAFPSS
jgi:hypothetical protein